jgi:glutamyl-tRNA synthetase
MSQVRTRFAPSPSGHLHVGGARTALFCWAYARGHDGCFVLRIEDTDRKRSSEAATEAFFEDLAWLGIDWDEGPQHDGRGGGATGPYYQSQRLDHYRANIQRLLDDGRAYRAFETPDELRAARAAVGEGYRYDRAALGLDPATIAGYLTENRPYVVRFRLPDDETIALRDVVRGEVEVALTELDDFVIQKADGYPTYHFAVVVDDELMGITHVIRGEEHLYNTARHVLLQEALGFRRPVYAHLSLIFNANGSKMSKRDKDRAVRRAVKDKKIEQPPAGISQDRWQWWRSSKNHQLESIEAEQLAETLEITLPEIEVEDFRRAGYLPEVLVNYLALLGWSPGGDVEKFDAKYLIKHFDLDRIIKSPAKFDRDKLLAFNLDALQAMSGIEFRDRLGAHGERYHPQFLSRLGSESFPLFAAANHARSKTLDDAYRSCGFLIEADDRIVYEQTKAVRKALSGGADPNGYAHLEALRPELDALGDWTIATLEQCVTLYADQHADGKLGKIAQPLRIAVSGGTISPAIFDTLAILGRASVLNRIDRCLATRSISSS